MGAAQAEVFLSYCWADSKIADEIYENLIQDGQINLHRDTLDIKKWESIKAYMQSIPQMDYMILLISEAYLKSSNCMYEVLEVMRDRKYKDKIFPAVIYTGIYDPLIRAGLVKYWQDELAKLKEALRGIETQNLGPLTEDLKHRQDIAANIAAFMGLVSDMNNPQMSNVADEIRKKLEEKGLLNPYNNKGEKYKAQGENLFETLGIEVHQSKAQITDLDINRFMVNSYSQIREVFSQLCAQFEKENSGWTVTVDSIDSRTIIYQFYRRGESVTGLKISLTDSFGSLNIGISNSSYSFGSSTSWNGLYSPKKKNGSLVLKSTFSIGNVPDDMGPQEVVKDIWMRYYALFK